MNESVLEAARDLVKRAIDKEVKGNMASPSDMRWLQKELEDKVPQWYQDLLTSVPLCGLELGWQSYEPEEDDDGISWMAWSSPDEIKSESVDAYPGLAILEKGFINVALDAMGGGDPYFLPTDQGDDPPLYQVYHDISDNAEEILKEGLELVAASLSEFFNTAKIAEPQ